MRKPQIVTRRPTETAAFSASALVGAALILFDVHLPPEKVGAIVILLGAAPAGITRLVTWWRARP